MPCQPSGWLRSTTAAHWSFSTLGAVTTLSTAASRTCSALLSTHSPTAAPIPPRYVHANPTLQTYTTTHQVYVDTGRDLEKEAYIRNGEPADRGLQLECAQTMHSAVAALNQRMGYVAVTSYAFVHHGQHRGSRVVVRGSRRCRLRAAGTAWPHAGKVAIISNDGDLFVRSLGRPNVVSVKLTVGTSLYDAYMEVWDRPLLPTQSSAERPWRWRWRWRGHGDFSRVERGATCSQAARACSRGRHGAFQSHRAAHQQCAHARAQSARSTHGKALNRVQQPAADMQQHPIGHAIARGMELDAASYDVAVLLHKGDNVRGPQLGCPAKAWT